MAAERPWLVMSAEGEPPIYQPDALPGSGGGLVMLAAMVAVGLLATRGTSVDQLAASNDLRAAADEYRKAEKQLIEAIISADKNDLGRNEIARHVEGIYSRQTVLTLLGSADLLQRAMTALEGSGLTGADVRVWQSKGRRLLMELIRDGDDVDRFAVSRIAIDSLAQAGINTKTNSLINPVRQLASGKVVELTTRAAGQTGIIGER